MKYKALFLDLDGTTVKPFADRPTEKVRHAILRADRVMQVCIATGRLLPGAYPVIEHLKLSGLCVVANGMQIYDPKRKKIIKEIALNPEYIKPIYNLLQKYKLSPTAFYGDMEMPFTGTVPKDKRILSFYMEPVMHQTADQILNELTAFPHATLHKTLSKTQDHVGIDICNVLATKQHGISDVIKILNIKPEEIIGVGDGYNDFPLLMACGLKVAMSNAVEDLKKIADFIAPSVEEDGVATVIEKFILAT